MSEIIQPVSTLGDLKTYLKISEEDNSKDALLNLLLESCTIAAERYMGRYIVARDITEEPHDFENGKSKYLQLEQYPVFEISKIVQNGEEIAVSSLKSDKYNGLIKKSTPWRGAVLASYKAGIADSQANVPANIRLAIWQWIAAMLCEQESGGLKSETLGDYSVTYYDERQVPSSSAMLLDSYRKVSL